MMRQMHRWFFILSCLALVFLAMPVHQAWAGTSDSGSAFGGEDKDEDGLTNDEEAQAGTAYDDPDTDGDHVKDGEDGWAGNAKDPDSNAAQAKLAPPRIPNTRYVVIDVGQFELNWEHHFRYPWGNGHNYVSGRSVYLSDSGDLAFAEADANPPYGQGDKKIWRFKSGALSMIYQRSSPTEEFFLGGIDNGGTVVATKYSYTPAVYLGENNPNNRSEYYRGQLQAYTSSGSWMPQAQNKTMFNAYDNSKPGLPADMGVDETVIGMSSSGKLLISSDYDNTYSFHQKSIMEIGGEMTPIDDTNSETYPRGELGFVVYGNGYHCINNDGVVAGNFYKWSDPAPFIGGVLDQGNIQQLGGNNLSLYSINNLGHIKGSNYVTDHSEGVIYLHKNDDYEEVKTAELPIYGDMNDRMEIVETGWSQEDSHKGKVWQNFKWVDLADRIATSPDAPKWTDIAILDLNNKGVIAATATKDGNKHLVLLVPVEIKAASPPYATSASFPRGPVNNIISAWAGDSTRLVVDLPFDDSWTLPPNFIEWNVPGPGNEIPVNERKPTVSWSNPGVKQLLVKVGGRYFHIVIDVPDVGAISQTTAALLNPIGAALSIAYATDAEFWAASALSDDHANEGTGKANALQHSAWNAFMASDIFLQPIGALYFSKAHEFSGKAAGSLAYDSTMDLHNNELGSEEVHSILGLADYSAIKSALLARLRSGDLWVIAPHNDQEIGHVIKSNGEKVYHFEQN